MRKPIVGITMGDATGIGPEIIFKALREKSIYLNCRPLVIGDAKRLIEIKAMLGDKIEINVIRDVTNANFNYGTIDIIDLDLLPSNIPFGRISPIAGDAAYQYLVKAVEIAKRGEIDAICTAPLNKEALQKGGHLYPGHTEILAELTETENYSMMLSSPNLKVIHLTTHLGLKDAIDKITPELTYNVICLANQTLVQSGVIHPRIAVCGINPHAGENGLFGNGEEEEKLVPGINKAKNEGIDVQGPYPADTLFYRAIRGDFDLIVACYHDQGHIPVKVLGLENGVNITVGLSGGIIRTSVDHGTAFDIAGKNIADEKSMKEAIKIAVELAPNRVNN
jgi:4-phospho-D-threonate 3-dehydrogenase / 4-phospho-D-erythronate 3-dehydrogenase